MFKKKILKVQYLWRNHLKDETPLLSEEEVDLNLKEIFFNVLISEERKEEIKNLSKESKSKLINEYKKFMEANKNSLKYISYKEISNLLEKLSDQPTIIDFYEARNWFLRATEADINVFCVYNGVKILFKKLQETEKSSRITKNYRKQMEILKLLEILTKVPNGPQEILKIKNCFENFLLNLHWMNIDMNCLSLEIMNHILWNSNEGHEFLSQALNKYKNEKNLKTRFDIFLIMLNKSKNIIMVEKWLIFLNNLISSCTNENKRLVLKSELLSSGINNIFEVYNKKINFKVFFFFE